MIVRNLRRERRFKDVAACVGKTKWQTEYSAQRAITRLRRDNPAEISSTVRPYRCSRCKRWHVGHGI